MRKCLCLLLLAILSSSAFAGLWVDVPFVRQPEKGCGSAVTSMVLQYWSEKGHPVLLPSEVGEIQRRLYSEEEKGVAASAIQEYLQDAGYEVYIFRGNSALLEKHLNRGRPLIVYLEDPGLRDVRHYVVVVGLSYEEGIIFVNDPAGRKLKKVSWSQFQEQWEIADYWTLLALPSVSH